MKTSPLFRLAGKFLPVVLFVALLLAAGAAPRASAAPAATTIFSESMFDGTTGVTGTQSISTFESNNYYQNDALTMTGDGDMRTTSASSGYTGASGSYNVFITNVVNRYFQIADINTVGYTNLTLSFGVFKSTTAENGSSFAVEVSSDGTNWTALSMTALPTGTGTAIWYYRTATGTIPATANLRIRFRNTSATPQFRVDDVLLVGDSAADTPPQVTTTSPSGIGVAVNSNVTINFNEAVDVTANGVTLECPVGTPVAFTSTPTLPADNATGLVLDPTSNLPYNTTCTVTAVAAQITDNDGTADQLDGDGNGTGGDDYVFTFTTIASDPCTEAATLIHDIQGSGASSSMTGQSKTIQGVVVGDFEVNGLRGYFVQEEDADADANPATSEGIFVFDSNTTSEVALGEIVRLTGTVTEYADRTVGGGTLTELSSPSGLLICGTGAATAASVTLPETTNGELEQYEGMKVSIASAMTVSQNYFVGRYGQMTLSSDGRMYQPTNQFNPGSANAIALEDENARRTLILDDGIAGVRCGDNPNPVPYLGSPPPAVIRAGDGVSNLVGVLDYGQIDSGETGPCNDAGTFFTGDYRLHPTQAPTFTTLNGRPSSPPAVAGSIKVASANALNFFNGDGAGGGFPTSRGATNFTEFVRQRIKFYEELSRLNADVVALAEIENDGYGSTSAIAELVKVLNQGPCWNSASQCSALSYSSSGMGAGTYAFIDADTLTGQSGALGSDEIKVGLLYKPATVTPVGTTAALNSTAFVNGGDGAPRSRPALAQAFEEIGSGERLVVVANHFKSKGSACDDPDAGDGQGNCNGVRTNAANALTAWLNGDPTKTAEPDALIVGDLNSYAKEDPIKAITNAGYTNLVNSFGGSAAYSYIFDGQSGYLDHALSSQSLTAQVAGTVDWHVNADEPAVIDYNTDFNPSGYYATNQYRSADHDPVLVGLNLATTDDLSDLTGYASAWHSSTNLRLGPTWAAGHAAVGAGTNDGLIAFTALEPTWSDGGHLTVSVQQSGNAEFCVYGWIDWNRNSSFGDSGEASTPAGGSVDGTIDVYWAAPGATPTGSYNLRLRVVPGACGSHLLATAAAGTDAPALSPSANLSPNGGTTGGEVEEHTLSFGSTAIRLTALKAAPARPWFLALLLIPGLALGVYALRRRSLR